MSSCLPGGGGAGWKGYLILENGVSQPSEGCQPFLSRTEELGFVQAAQAAGAGVPQAHRDPTAMVTPVGAGSEGRAPGLRSPPKYILLSRYSPELPSRLGR